MMGWPVVRRAVIETSVEGEFLGNQPNDTFAAGDHFKDKFRLGEKIWVEGYAFVISNIDEEFGDRYRFSVKLVAVMP